MFYTFNQNNSGGKFDFQPNDGITHFVIIEANNETHAMQRALDIGLYFNGCDAGVDCNCCGDRWSMPSDDSGTESPELYGRPPAEYEFKWMPDGMETCVHYLDGRKEWFGVKPRERA